MPMRYPSDADADADARIVALLHTNTNAHSRTLAPFVGPLASQVSRVQSAAQRGLCASVGDAAERESEIRA